MFDLELLLLALAHHFRSTLCSVSPDPFAKDQHDGSDDCASAYG